MSRVYLAIPGAPDRLLGHVHDDGRIYHSQAGPDVEIGHVDLTTGRVYQQRFGPDEELGHVDLNSGRVYAGRLGPDEYLGEVRPDGSMHRHVAMAPDHYVGKVDSFISYAHSGGAMLLLVLPAL